MTSVPAHLLAAAESGSGINPIVVGGGVFLVLLALLVGLLAFGGGREHS